MTFKYCLVPECCSTTIKTPNKIFLSVPKKKKVRILWEKIIRRDTKKNKPLSENSTRYICEDHFSLEHDLENYMEFRLTQNVKYLRLKPGVVPHFFACQNRLLPLQERSAVSKKTRLDLVRDAIASTSAAITLKRADKSVQENPNLYHRILNSLQVTQNSQTNSNPTTDSSFSTQISIKQEIDDNSQITPELHPTLNATHDGQVSIKQESEQNSIQETSESQNIPYPTLEYVPETPSITYTTLECLPESQNIPYPNLEYVPESQDVSHPTLECVPESKSSSYSTLEVPLTIKEENEHMDIETTPESDTSQDPTFESTPNAQTSVAENISNDIQSAPETNSCPTSQKIQVMLLSDKQKSKIFEELFIKTNKIKISLERGNMYLQAKLKEEMKKNTAFRIESNQQRIILEHDILILKEKLQQEEKKMNDIVIKSNQRKIILEHDIMFLKEKLKEERKNVNALRSVFREDQLKNLISDSTLPKHWSESTVETALSLRRSCGLAGYQALLDLGLPFPDINTLQVAHAERDSSSVLLSRVVQTGKEENKK